VSGTVGNLPHLGRVPMLNFEGMLTSVWCSCSVSPNDKAPLFREWLLQVAQSAMPATAGESATVWKSVIGVYVLCSFAYTSASWIPKDELGTLKHLRRYLGECQGKCSNF
jgi:hypothetical protein